MSVEYDTLVGHIGLKTKLLNDIILEAIQANRTYRRSLNPDGIDYDKAVNEESELNNTLEEINHLSMNLKTANERENANSDISD